MVVSGRALVVGGEALVVITTLCGSVLVGSRGSLVTSSGAVVVGGRAVVAVVSIIAVILTVISGRTPPIIIIVPRGGTSVFTPTPGPVLSLLPPQITTSIISSISTSLSESPTVTWRGHGPTGDRRHDPVPQQGGPLEDGASQLVPARLVRTPGTARGHIGRSVQQRRVGHRRQSGLGAGPGPQGQSGKHGTRCGYSPGQTAVVGQRQ